MSGRGLRWVWLAASTAAVVALAGFAVHGLAGPGEPAAPQAPEPVAAEEHYYLMLPLIEVRPRRPDGGQWDANGSAPDIYYQVEWQGHVVFESSTKKDTLVARWSAAELDVGLLADRVSVDEAIRAARVTVRRGGRVRIRVLDADLLRDDPIAEWEVPLEGLQRGDQIWKEPAPAIVSAACRLIPVENVDLEELTR